MKTLVAILAVAAVAGGFTGMAVACGPEEDDNGAGEWNVTAAREDAGAFEADMIPRMEPIKEGSDEYQYPPTLGVTLLHESMEAALAVWIELF